MHKAKKNKINQVYKIEKLHPVDKTLEIHLLK